VPAPLKWQATEDLGGRHCATPQKTFRLRRKADVQCEASARSPSCWRGRARVVGLLSTRGSPDPGNQLGHSSSRIFFKQAGQLRVQLCVPAEMAVACSSLLPIVSVQAGSGVLEFLQWPTGPARSCPRAGFLPLQAPLQRRRPLLGWGLGSPGRLAAARRLQASHTCLSPRKH
jgi:hypothetical protein